jgi:general secretion pathway protein L
VAEYLVVRLAEASSTASWIALSEQGHQLTAPQSGSLTDAARHAPGRKVVLLVPGLDVIITRVELPARRQSRIQRMLPYSLEDFVADDVETLLFAAGPRRPDGSLPVAIAARDLLEGWLAQCSEAGLAPDAVFADVQGVPDTPGNLTLLLEGTRIYGRLPERDAFVLEGLPLASVVEILQADEANGASLKHIVAYADPEGYLRHEDALEQMRSTAASVDVQLLQEGLLPRLAATLVNEPGSDLLQGPYKPKSNWVELSRPWRVPAALAAALVVVAVATLAGRYFALTREDRALTALLEASCVEAFQIDGLAACDQEIRGRLALSGADPGATGGPVFLETLGAVAEARDPRTALQTLSFSRGATTVRLTAPDIPSLDTFRQTLGGDGRYQVEIQSTNAAGDGIEGRVLIAELER